MKNFSLVPQTANLLNDPDSELSRMVYIARISHRTEDKADQDQKSFISKILALRHYSVFEFADVVMKFYTSRAIANELVRHRAGCSYMQECVTGDTKIRKNLTIQQLYERQYKGNCYDKTHNKTIKLRSVNNAGLIIHNKFNEVFYKGIQPVYEVETELGYKIKCTKNHKFLTKDNVYVTLNNLQIGSKLMVNGRNCLCYIEDSKLIHLYNNECLNPIEISQAYSIPYRSVVRQLKQLGIFKIKKNDKNKEKYNKNHTSESYTKMGNTARLQYKNGRRVWNKGLTEFDSESVKRQADSLRLHHHNNEYGEKNSFWKGGPKDSDKARQLKQHITTCELCKSCIKLEVHHKDKNRSNNSMSNLIKVCCKCHNLLHHGWHIGTKAVEDTIKTITYIGKEPVYDLEMKDPYNNYVANGFIVHNSTRYVNYNKRLGIQIIEDKTYTLTMLETIDSLCDIYNRSIEAGIKPEDARNILPLGLGSTIAVKTNLREWGYIFGMRYYNKKAHHMFRDLLELMLIELRNKAPESAFIIEQIAQK